MTMNSNFRPLKEWRIRKDTGHPIDAQLLQRGESKAEFQYSGQNEEGKKTHVTLFRLKEAPRYMQKNSTRITKEEEKR